MPSVRFAPPWPAVSLPVVSPSVPPASAAPEEESLGAAELCVADALAEADGDAVSEGVTLGVAVGVVGAE